jgi:hypothetical protein
LKNITERLDRLITLTLHPSNLKNVTVTDQLAKQWVLDIKTEKENIRLQLIQQGFYVSNEKTLALFVQSCQLTITHYIDVLVGHNYAIAFSITSERKLQLASSCYKNILEQLEELLSFIEQRFATYFNQHEKVPDSYLLISKIEIKQQLKHLKKALDKKELSKELLGIVLSPIANFVGDKASDKFSYLQLMYIKTLVKELKDYGHSQKKDELSLLEILVYLNFNDISLASYSLSKLHGEANALEELEAKLEHYALYQKQFSQVFRKPNIILCNELPSLYDMLVGWIEDEKQFLQTKVIHNNTPEERTPEEISEGDLIKLSFSSPQLALFIRSMKETDVILNHNRSLVLRNISKIVKTMRSEKDLSNALQSEYYKTAKDLQTIRKVKDVVIKMLNYLIKLEKENK